ncbi:MAG: ArsR family transcriptional regulator [Elusimicrobia bacterium]|nr:MAG: ArsR family transcriptional regulator [Elusimicrobiota bacterium]
MGNSNSSDTLSPAAEQFLVHWGEMGSRWGINRTVAEIHSLLYITDRPLCAEEIQRTLGVARSNVSTSIRELQGWNLIKTVRTRGDRRYFFETYRDPWQLFQIVIEERKKRELDPSRDFLRALVGEMGGIKRDAFVKRQLTALLEHLDTVAAAYEQFRSIPLALMRRVLRMGGRLRKAVEALG